MTIKLLILSTLFFQTTFAAEKEERPTFNSVFSYKDDLVGKPGSTTPTLGIVPFEYETGSEFASSSSIELKKEKMTTLFPVLTFALKPLLEPAGEEGKLPYQAFGNRLSPNCTLAMSLQTTTTDASETVTLDPADFKSVNAKYVPGNGTDKYYIQQFHVSRKNKQTKQVKDLGEAVFVCKGTTTLHEATELIKNKLGVSDTRGIKFYQRFNNKPVERHVEVKAERGVAGKKDK